MSNLLKRSITGILFVAVLLTAILVHPYLFALVFGAIMFFTLFEFYNLLESTQYKPQKILGLVLGLILFIICFAAVSGIIPRLSLTLIAPMLIIVFIYEVFKGEGNMVQSSALTIFGLVYIVFPFCLMNFIIYPGIQIRPNFNPGILAGVFFIIWVCDSMAFIGGSRFGKHKLAEKISPKKTWEGLIIGGVFGIIMGILNAIIFNGINILNWIVIALIVVASGTVGDLFESKIKRTLNIKDSGSILPGHGGLLDRFDSILFAIPLVYIWLTIAGVL